MLFGMLSSVLTLSTRPRDSLALIQSSLATPWLPVLHAILNATPAATVCICLLHPPAAILPSNLTKNDQKHLRFIDWTMRVPGYEPSENESWIDLSNKVCNAIDNAPHGPVLVVVDSPDTLCEDVGSPSKTYTMLKSWHTAVTNRPIPSRIVLPVPSRSPLLPLLVTHAFAPSIAYLTLHPPSLIRHLSTNHLTLPPPYSPPTKFWPIFSSLATRGEGERLVWGADGHGWGNEMIVEVLVRNAGGKRTVERSLDGWKSKGVCKLEELDDLRGIWTKNVQPPQMIADPTHNLPFNLTLTEVQQHSRAQVPLPYAHEGSSQASKAGLTGGVIFYEPDSADDIDEDDPDEDLDI